jgi:hypothetical protein
MDVINHTIDIIRKVFSVTDNQDRKQFELKLKELG